MIIVFSVVVIPVSASTSRIFTVESEAFNDLTVDVESEFFWTTFRDLSISGTTVNSDESENQYYIEISGYGLNSESAPFFGCAYISFDEKPKIYYNSSEDMYYIYLNYVPFGLTENDVSYMNYRSVYGNFNFVNGSWNQGSYGGSLKDSSSNYLFSFNKDCSVANFKNLSLDNLTYNVYFSWDTEFNKKDVDIKVNVDDSSDTLPTSIDITENSDFYIDITNNLENAIQFAAWISDTPASSGAYNSYSRLNWTYSKQQWAYVYHGTWGDSARNVLDIYGQVVDTVDLIGLAWWKDVLINGIDNVLPNAYYSQDNISSPFHYCEGFGGTFKQKFSFNTATLSKNKEYYFNIVYRPIVQIKVNDDGYGTYWLPTDVIFHDNFTDLDYYDLGYCTAFSLGTDTAPDSSVSVDYPSDFNTTVINTKSPSATMGNDGTITVSGGSNNNDLNNSINFSPKIDNSNYNGGVTINNNLGSGGSAGSYGDFDGDVSQLNKLLTTCTNFFGFLKSGLTAFMPSDSMFIVLFSSGFLIIIFLRILGR